MKTRAKIWHVILALWFFRPIQQVVRYGSSYGSLVAEHAAH
jgi:hypothetical protein